MSDLDKFNYECEDQIDIFDLIRKPISITKPIRLIELFAGYGSQAMALRDIGAKFEHWKISHHGVAHREQLSHLKTSMTKT